MITVLVHIQNAEPFKLDIEEMPRADDNVLIGKNPRERTERPVDWLDDDVTMVIFPWWRITFIEILPQPGEEAEFPLPFRND